MIDHDEEVKKITSEYCSRALKGSNLGADLATFSAANSQLGSQEVTRLADYDQRKRNAASQLATTQSKVAEIILPNKLHLRRARQKDYSQADEIE